MTISKFDMSVFCPLHGIPKPGLTSPDVARLDSSWVGPFPGEAARLCEHIRRSVEIAAMHPSALLFFSGADTKQDLPERSEAKGAFEIASDHDWFGYPEVAARCHCEEDARDSAQNAAFTAFLFRRLTGRIATRTVAVGWGFKGTRFAAHAAGLPFLENGIEYVGVNNPPLQNFEAALSGELNKLRKIVEAKDWLLDAPEWAEQRRLRNPQNREHPYAEEIATFLR
jgi:hypothetical protein